MKPGDVTLHGEIVMRDGSLLQEGAVYVSLVQALKAHRYGWRLLRAECRDHRTVDYVIRRQTTNA